MATPSSVHAVTGAFGYSGKYIAQQLLAKGRRVITLTNSFDRANEFGGQIPVFPFHFDRPDALTRALQNVDVLYTIPTGCASTTPSSATPMPCKTR